MGTRFAKLGRRHRNRPLPGGVPASGPPPLVTAASLAAFRPDPRPAHARSASVNLPAFASNSAPRPVPKYLKEMGS